MIRGRVQNSMHGLRNALHQLDRQRQPWLIFSAHRVLGYSSNNWLSSEGAFGELMGQAHLQKLWKKYKWTLLFTGMSISMRGLALYISVRGELKEELKEEMKVELKEEMKNELKEEMHEELKEDMH